MKIYNSLSGKKEDFKPLNKAWVGMYVCGPTVYDQPHIGHARAAYIFEMIRSYLEYQGYRVKFVRNITDVDDKIIAKAKEELPELEINQAVKQVAEKYTQQYYQDMQSLGIRRADIQPRATEHIEQMKQYIEKLIIKQYAYACGGDVYFSVRNFPDYGQLSHQDIGQIRNNVRIENDQNKQDPMDFALWKKAKPDEPFWDSPWGRGRPGWHIECSVMSSKYLGDEFDIHGGGLDLIFPHHENERAQSCAYSGGGFARFWIHNGLLTINGQKMAKSLGNFVSITDFLQRGYHAEVLKLFFLQAHYSQPIDFSWERIQDKQRALETIAIFLLRTEQRTKEKPPASSLSNQLIKPEQLRQEIDATRREFKNAMDDDFNTPNAIAVLFELITKCNKVLYSSNLTQDYLLVLVSAAEAIKELGGIFGLSFQAQPQALPKEEIKALIAKREEFKRKKMFKEADQIRLQLKQKNIILEDSSDGKTLWR